MPLPARNPAAQHALRVIDSHTGGEPTRVVIDGLPPMPTAGGAGSLGPSPAAAARDWLQSEHDWVRTALTLEPWGAPWMVGAALLPPSSPQHNAGVVFFNNTGYLGMCGHGLIGVVETLRHLGRLRPGRISVETPPGPVTAELHADGTVSFENVPSRRLSKDVRIEVPGVGPVLGDIAYGGNWFFMTRVEAIEPSRLADHTALATAIRWALVEQQVRGDDGGEIDHIELLGPPSDPAIADSRAFILCPGGEYDRSPCGTGTSAKMACLAADGRLAPGEEYAQESIIGSVFRGSYQPVDGGVLPTIRGRAHVVADGSLLIDPANPLREGFSLAGRAAFVPTRAGA